MRWCFFVLTMLRSVALLSRSLSLAAAAISVSACFAFAGAVHDDLCKNLGDFCSVALLSRDWSPW
jgi:hypothetical protein